MSNRRRNWDWFLDDVIATTIALCILAGIALVLLAWSGAQ